MKTTTVIFRNKPEADGTVTSEIAVPGCVIAQNGTPTAQRPQILIHLPKKFKGDVDDSWVNHEDHSYHVIGVSTKYEEMDPNVPTSWNRYAIAERIY